MHDNATRRIAVLTGDIVRSSTLDPAELAAVRAAILDACRATHDPRLPAPEFFRGDGWQAVAPSGAAAFRTALRVRAELARRQLHDTRIAIGLGAADHLDSDRVTLSTGPAFTVSGHALDDMPARTRMHLADADPRPATDRWALAALHLADAVIRGWTPRQGEAIVLALADDAPTSATIGERLDPPVSRQAVDKILNGAAWPELRAIIDAFDTDDTNHNPIRSDHDPR